MVTASHARSAMTMPASLAKASQEDGKTVNQLGHGEFFSCNRVDLTI